MSNQHTLAWGELSPAVRATFEWAWSCESASGERDIDVGTRSLLVGLARETETIGAILSEFGSSADDLFDLLRRGGRRIDPWIRRRAALTEIPPLTKNAEAALAEAVAIQRTVLGGQNRIEPDVLLAGILAVPDGSARQGLSSALRGVDIDQVQSLLVRWLQRPTLPIGRALRNAFPDLRPTSGDASSRLDQIILVLASRGGEPTSDTVSRIRESLSTAGYPSRTGSEPSILPNAEADKARVGLILCMGAGWRDAIRKRDMPVETASRFPFVAVAFLPGAEPETFDDLHEIYRGLPRYNLRERSDGIRELLSDIESFAVGTRAQVPALEGRITADHVDHAGTIAASDDHLGLKTEVSMLARTIADRRTPLPLSIGLFGRWGSGKSYFMGLLRGEIDRLSESGNEAFCADVVHIGFNAWHYADTNLWASLGDEIFRQLAKPQVDDRGRADQLREKMETRIEARARLGAAHEEAKRRTKDLRAALDENVARRSTVALAAARALGKDLWRQAKLRGNERDIERLGRELEGLSDDFRVVRDELHSSRSTTIVAALIAIALATGVGIAVAQWSLVAVTGTATLAVGLLQAVRIRSRAIARRVQLLGRDIRAAKLELAASEIDALREAEADELLLQSELEGVVQEVRELQAQIAQVSPGQALYRFLAAKAEGDQYRQGLGLVSMIRRDFEQLVQLLQEWREHPDKAEGHRPIDRIVLYIDDLDRCSPEQVVEVLRAVHLLLSLDLFVVVVGVDPRWLEQSLSVVHGPQLALEVKDAGLRSASPHDYLEKIFNIPLTLPTIDDASFRQLISGLGFAAVAAEADGNQPRAMEPIAASGEGGPNDESVLSTGSITAEPGSQVDAGDARVAESPRLELTSRELAILSVLGPLIATPRAAKRMMNIYNMLRSTRDLGSASAFLGDASKPGEHEAVAVLLGIVSGHHADLYGRVASAISDAGANDTWGAVVRSLAAASSESTGALTGRASNLSGESARVERLVLDLNAISSELRLTDLDAYRSWAPVVARFSFSALSLDA